MIFYLVCFLGRISDGMRGLFWFHPTMFHNSIKIISVSFLWWWDGIYDGVMVSSNELFFFFLPSMILKAYLLLLIIARLFLFALIYYRCFFIKKIIIKLIDLIETNYINYPCLELFLFF